MDDITKRIERVTGDLRAIQQELDAPAGKPASPQQSELVDQLVGGDLLKDLKSAVDQMRHFLWAYIDATSREGDTDLRAAIQAYRMQRVTEMLKMLREVDEPPLAAIPESRSFFEEINAIAHATIERYATEPQSSSGSPASAPKK